MPINALTPHTETVTLYQGDDQAHLAELRAEVARLKPSDRDPKPAVTLDEAGDYTIAKEAADEFAADMEERAVKVTVRALGRKTWRTLVAEHAAREGNDDDDALGINVDTFPDALVPASIASPVFDSNEDRDYFLDALSDIQFEALFTTAFTLNRTLGADPKARLS